MSQENKKEMQHVENIVQICENRMFTTSLIVADAFEKEHFNVLRDIEKLECSEEFNALNFEAVEYKDAKGEMRPAYRMTRDGFAFLAMGFTGKKAAAWKEKFLEAFNAMAGIDDLTESGVKKVIMAAWNFLNHAWRYAEEMCNLEKLGLLLNKEEVN